VDFRRQGAIRGVGLNVVRLVVEFYCMGEFRLILETFFFPVISMTKSLPTNLNSPYLLKYIQHR